MASNQVTHSIPVRALACWVSNSPLLSDGRTLQDYQQHGNVMKISKKLREEMIKLCGAICEDDGRDPREFHETKNDRKKSDQYRHERLCQQVARTLALVLPESVAEPIHDLKIDSVVRGRNASVLRVKIAVPKWVDHDQQTELLELLKSQEGWLRSEVAAAITRKRVPRLAFEFTVREINEGDVL